MSGTDWNWEYNTDPKWLTADPQAYYLAERWMQLDYLTVLDHGCGLGRHSVFFSKAGFVVTAFDRSATGLEHTAKWAAHDGAALRTVSGDMLDIPLPDESFDAVMCYNVIYHATLDEVKKAAKEIARVMKPGSELFITMCSKSSPNFLNAKTLWDDGCTVPSDNSEGNSAAHCYLNYKEMVSVFEDFEFAAEPVDQLEYENGRLKNAHWVLLLRRK